MSSVNPTTPVKTLSKDGKIVTNVDGAATRTRVSAVLGVLMGSFSHVALGNCDVLTIITPEGKSVDSKYVEVDTPDTKRSYDSEDSYKTASDKIDDDVPLELVSKKKKARRVSQSVTPRSGNGSGGSFMGGLGGSGAAPGGAGAGVAVGSG